jgi:hypothetical protein
MDLIDLMAEKKWIGMEFLTWMYLVRTYGLSEAEAEVWLEDRMTLEAGSGNEKRSMTLVEKESEFMEVPTALREGKLIRKARVVIGDVGGDEYRMTVDAHDFTLTGIKVPPNMRLDEEEEQTLTGRMLDRIGQLTDAVKALDGLFEEFLNTRFGPEWPQAVDQMRSIVQGTDDA